MSSQTSLIDRLDNETNLFVQKKLLHGVAEKKKVSFYDFLNNKMLIISAIKEGIPYSLFDLIQSSTPFSEKEWASLLEISTKSLLRYKKTANHNFKSLQTEKIIEMAEVTKLGLEVFGDKHRFRVWLKTPNFSLGNLSPLELLQNSYGKELVVGELVRINNGIFV